MTNHKTISIHDIHPGQRFKATGEAEHTYRIRMIDTIRMVIYFSRNGEPNELVRVTASRFLDLTNNKYLIPMEDGPCQKKAE